jgi:hypothetical protein
MRARVVEVVLTRDTTNRKPSPALSAAVNELITAFGAARLAEAMGVQKKTMWQWRTQVAPGADATWALLRAARVVEASPGCFAALEAHIAEREAAVARRDYIGASAIFSRKHGWPPTPEQARERRRLYPPLRRPLPPPALPEGLSDEQIALLRARFEAAGWVIVPALARGGRLVPCRTI